MKTTNLPPSKILNYSIHDCSGFSANYRPENVRLNEPTEQASRWSSAANDQNQFLILKLEKLAILDYITFGKFHKAHVCNLKEFKVFVGPDLESLQLIIHSGLNNDTEAESFPPNPAHQQIPVKFIKVVPIAAWGSNFNFSIWFLEVRGWTAEETVRQALTAYKSTKERHTTRLVLKYLRDGNFTDAFNSLQAATGVALEDPSVSQLWSLLRENRFEEAEQLITHLYSANPAIFDEYLHSSVPYAAEWECLNSDSVNSAANANNFLDENGDFRMADHHLRSVEAGQPSPRGGHQMCFDPQSRTLFLFGGWDGRKDLGDFWKCSVDVSGPLRWELISLDVERDGGPAACSCHKATLHVTSGDLYVLGRYVEPERRGSLDVLSNNANNNNNSTTLPCPFYKFSTRNGQWTRLSADVREEGGPACIYDHQMVIDEAEDVIWVFGGRTLGLGSSDATYSGLYKYEIKTAKWTLIKSDNNNTGNSGNPGGIHIPSRIGHSMLWDPIERSLLILSGQRNKDYLADFYRFSVDSGSVTLLLKNLQLVGGPEAGFTQRACLDPNTREMFVFSGLMRSNGSNTTGEDTPALSNGDFWSFDLEKCSWSRISCKSSSNPVPPHRFAHQIAYDPLSRVHYLFGGNPGNQSDPGERLGDFWRVKLMKTCRSEDILRRCQYAIRAARFKSLLAEPLRALAYLQGDLAAVVDHGNEEESLAFRSLSQALFTGHGNISDSNHDAEEPLFETLIKYFPTSMQPPHGQLY